MGDTAREPRSEKGTEGLVRKDDKSKWEAVSEEGLPRLTRFTSKWLGRVMFVVVTVQMLIVTSDVFGRYILNHPVKGATEVTGYLLLVGVFAALVWSWVNKVHVRMDLVVSNFSPRL